MDLQHIQWFPGHMTKAMRMMEENIKLCDGVIFVLDARAPFACRNKVLESKLANRPFLYVLNKCDLISESDKDYIVSVFAKEGIKVVPTASTIPGGSKNVFNAFKGLLSEKIERNKAKGINKTLRAMVAGVPNTGKSTLINALCGKKATMVGDKAGVTRGKQWVRLDGFELLDTPGTMPPSIENNLHGLHLAFIGGLNDNILDVSDLCFYFIEELLKINPQVLTTRYGIETKDKTTLEIYESICVRMGCLVRGGDYDYERCGKAVIDDFRKGRLGKICLEGKVTL
ncbi:MAG: ribosome biogenesis GTPase YlqF [Clostridia bacterium]|nr:ribosome biogenesis GTPase YlqF [Clostridia bacterium]